MTEIGIISILVFIIIALMGAPIAFVMALVGFAGIVYMISFTGAMDVLARDFFVQFSGFSLTAVPMFVFMGEIAFAAGISERLYAAGNKLFGQIKGGLAIASIAACAGFAAICGSTAATAAAMGSVAIPQMKKYGYKDSLSTGCVAAAGTLGILIPPSTTFIIYGIMTEQRIGKLFIAGILPGLLLATLFSITVLILCRLDSKLGPAGPKTTFMQKLLGLSGIMEAVIIFSLVIGGLFAGWFTPTQSGAAGAAAVLAVALVRKTITWKGFFEALKSTIAITSFILCILAGGLVFGRLIALTQIPFAIGDWATGLAISPIAVMGLIIIIHLIGGCFMDAFALIVLTIPIFFPVVVALGFDPIWYGVAIVLMVEMAAITPPVGLNVYVIKGVAPDVPLGTIFKGIWPFVGALVVCTGLLVVFPQIATFLPQLMSY
ncbi:TRAP transporter large permease [Chloroflexota bacterium]